MSVKPSIPKGTRDFLPQVVNRRNYIVNTIRSVFELYGYQPIETPAMENLSTLTGKYGDEGDKLLFRILNSGDYLKKADKEAIAKEDSSALAPSISEKGLRYDLTIPFARFAVMNRNDIALPFKRYQIQTVWRADRPQKGRYREFWQCDADVIGSDSLINELELTNIYSRVFSSLGLDVTIRINNRKILEGLVTDVLGVPDKLVPFTVILDKLDKIGAEKVMDQIKDLGLDEAQMQTVSQYLSIDTSDTGNALKAAEAILNNSETGMKGIQELRFVIDAFASDGLAFDPNLARGLNYYTGCIWEVMSNEVKIGTIASGGRYDDLTGLFGWSDVSGVGISFGLDRIYDVLSELDRFPEAAEIGTEVLIINFGKELEEQAWGISEKLRSEGIATELYPDDAKIQKQMKYANNKNIAYVLFAGSEELSSGNFKFKNMASGEESMLDLNAIISQLKS